MWNKEKGVYFRSSASTSGVGLAANVSAATNKQPCNPPIGGTAWQGSTYTFGPGDWCVNNGNNRAIFQYDGNLVVYRNGVATWSSKTNGRVGPNGYLSLQWDGNVVIYNGSNQPVWATGTSGNYGQRMSFTIQSDNNLVVYRNYTQAVWAKSWQ